MKPRKCDYCNKESHIIFTAIAYPKSWPEEIAGKEVKLCRDCMVYSDVGYLARSIPYERKQA